MVLTWLNKGLKYLIDYIVVRRSDISDGLITHAMRALTLLAYLKTRVMGPSAVTVGGYHSLLLVAKSWLGDASEADQQHYSHCYLSQCGLRKSRGMIDMIFTARQFQEKCREQHRDLFMTFVDLSKAFWHWTVSCYGMFFCQQHPLPIPWWNGGLCGHSLKSLCLSVSTGVRHGCMLAQVLFNIFLLCVTQLYHKELEDSSGVAVNFRLERNLFNIRRLQVTTKLSEREPVLELQDTSVHPGCGCQSLQQDVCWTACLSANNSQ